MSKEQIPDIYLNQVIEFFQHYGYRGPSMDDIAKNLGISKKTLYRYVSNKEELIIQSLERSEQVDASEEFKEFDVLFDYLVKQTYNIPQPYVEDLQNYYPKALDVYNNKIVKANERRVKSYINNYGSKETKQLKKFLSKQLAIWISQIIQDRISRVDAEQALQELKRFITYRLN